MKSSLVYDVPTWSGDGFFSMPRRSLGEVQKVHDPLVVVASLFSPRLLLTEEDQLQVLKTQFDARHHTEERLWSGRDLTTDHIVTNVRLWPAHHLAYSETVVTVFNHGEQMWGTGQEEAIYTFHLPEGGTVTSLSLWIGGREEKAVLTTKGKADSAYREIVGVEHRDPSVEHRPRGGPVRAHRRCRARVR